MAHFAKIENNIVVKVIVADQDFINSGLVDGVWLQTSYNTRGNVHYDQNGNPDNGIALRANYAGIGYTYDQTNDVFYAPQPYESWVLNNNTWLWESPTPMPTDGKMYGWDEATQSWLETLAA